LVQVGTAGSMQNTIECHATTRNTMHKIACLSGIVIGFKNTHTHTQKHNTHASALCPLPARPC
jgi:hypothetical protein